MAYTKNTWADGDIVTSEKLNHMEDGIADAGGVMVINDTDGMLDKTWQEIYDALAQGKLCAAIYNSGNLETGISVRIVTNVDINEGVYAVDASGTYTTSSATGYPEIGSGPTIPR